MFGLKVTTGDAETLRPAVEAVLRRFDITWELRSAGPKELVYEAQLPFPTRTDRVSNAILLLEGDGEKEVVWEDKKKK